MYTDKELDEKRNVDLNTVDIDTLVDLNDVHIDENLSPKERLISFIKQIKNPYCFKVGKIVVKQSFSADGPTLEDRFKEMFSRMQ